MGVEGRLKMALVVEEAEEAELLKRMAASVEAEVAGQAMKWEEEAAGEEDHLLQAVVALVFLRLGVGEEVPEEQSFRSVPGLEVEVVAAFLQLQHSILGTTNLLEVPLEGAAEDRPSVQVEEAVLKECVCPRKVVVH